MRPRDLRALEFDKVLGLLAACAVSEPARARLRTLAPAADRPTVAARLRASAELVELRSHSGALPIAEFVDLNALFLDVAPQGATLDGASLLQVRQFVLSARHLEAFLRSRCERFPAVAALANSLVAPKELADALLRALGDDGGLLDDASRELHRLRNQLRNERAELENRLGRSLDSPGMQPFLTDHLVTVRNRRFVLPLKPNYAERLEGIVQDRSVSGETLFVEPLWAVELNNRLMMLEREVQAEETRILSQLSQLVRGYLAQLRMTFEALVALDALNARAIFAERYRCVEPELAETGLVLRAARHPLLMASGRTVVPIDLSIAPERIGLVISGPNTGGKTVALKTLGLLCLMAQSGLLVPAERGTRLPVLSGIYADIGDEQSIEADLSTFSAHIANLAQILSRVAAPALVLLDEPGAGTDPAEGGALTIAIMRYLGAHQCLVALATHSSAVKLYAYGSPLLESAAVNFDEQHLLPLYTLTPHTFGQSYGLAIAERLGMPAEVIASAHEARPGGSLELEQALRRLERQREELSLQTELDRERERERQQAHLQALEVTERAQQQAEREREQNRLRFQQLVADFQRESGRVLQELKASRSPRGEIRQVLNKAAAELSAAGLQAAEPAHSEPLKVGDQVELGELQGELLQLEGERAVIGRGGMRIEVAATRLRRASAKQKLQAPAPRTIVESERPQAAEVNLIGMRAGDALRRLEEFLDQAYLTSKPEVLVLHGVGSGALRKAVHDYLGNSPYCAGFHEAEPRQGGAGATVVQLSL